MDCFRFRKNHYKKNNFYRQTKLTKTDEFSSVFNFRRRLYSEHLMLNFKPNQLNFARVGFVVAKKTAKSAVSRNYMRRVLREFFRSNQCEIGAFDLVINVRKKFTRLNFNSLQFEFSQLSSKIAVYSSKSI